MKNAIIFDKQYSNEKLKEGIAVQEAVITGACDRCKYLHKCQTNNNFEFPKDADCMKILEQLKNIEIEEAAKTLRETINPDDLAKTIFEMDTETYIQATMHNKK